MIRTEKMERDTVSVVIPTVNNFQFLRACVGYLAINAGRKIDELIVVCDEPGDMMINYLYWLMRMRDVHIIINPHPVGLVRGFNMGFKLCTKKYVVMLADDMLIQENWLPPLITMITKHPNYGWISSLQKNYKWVRFTAMCSLISRELLEEVGYLDELFHPCTFDDADLMMTLLKKGYTPHGCSDSLAYHLKHEATCGPLWVQKDPLFKQKQQKKFKDKWGIDWFEWSNVPVHSSEE